MTRRSKNNPALVGDRVRLRVELTGRTEEGVPYRGQPGIEADVLEVRPDGRLLLRVGRNGGICVADPTDIDRVRH